MRIAIFIDQNGVLSRSEVEATLATDPVLVDIIEIAPGGDITEMLGLLDRSVHSIILALDPRGRALDTTLAGLGRFSVEFLPENDHTMPHLGADAVFRGMGAQGLGQAVQLIRQRIERQA